MNLYVSTACLKNGKDVRRVLDVYEKLGIKNIELGSLHCYIQNVNEEIIKYKQRLNFIVHHYFPPPENSIVVNLASPNVMILKKSIEQIKNSIEFCSKLGIELFSFHAGFRADPDRGFWFDKNKPVASYKRAFETFVESVREINNYAVKKRVKLAVENNVLSEPNLVNGKNRFLLMCEHEEFEQFFNEISSDNLGITLDLGHLQVSSHWLDFDKHEFVDRLKEKIFSIHVHENNGKMDEHKPLDENSWCFKIVARKCFNEIPIILESMNLTIGEIIRNKKLIEDFGTNNCNE